MEWLPGGQGSAAGEGGSRAGSRDSGRVESSQKGGHGMMLGCHTGPCCYSQSALVDVPAREPFSTVFSLF